MRATPRRKRFALVLGGVAVLGAAAAFVLNAFQSNLVFFFSPSQVHRGEAPVAKVFRVGGLVKEGSLQRNGTDVRFVVTDHSHDVPVHYVGLLPDLFQEGKGVVAQGKIGPGGGFEAQQVLAKHDENYMPPEAAQALDDAARERAAKSLKE
jgi:cytochrome c-type biogenesis protein CcmE